MQSTRSTRSTRSRVRTYYLPMWVSVVSITNITNNQSTTLCPLIHPRASGRPIDDEPLTIPAIPTTETMQLSHQMLATATMNRIGLKCCLRKQQVVGYYIHGLEERNLQCDLIQTNITSIKSLFSYSFSAHTSNVISSENKCLLRYQSLHVHS